VYGGEEFDTLQSDPELMPIGVGSSGVLIRLAVVLRRATAHASFWTILTHVGLLEIVVVSCSAHLLSHFHA
jgi:hypothetical protein